MTAASVSLSPDPEESFSVVERYKDAYRVAKATVAFGKATKFVGMVIAGLIFLLSLAPYFLSSQQTMQNSIQQTKENVSVSVALVVCALLVGAFFYILGIVICSLGQIQQATLDSAINSSPFLSNGQRAEAMSLASGGTDATGELSILRY